MASTAMFPLAPDEDRAYEVGRFLATATRSDSNSLAEQFKKTVEDGKIAEFITAVLKFQETVVSAATEEEAEGFYTMLCSFFEAVGDDEFVDTVVEGIARFLVGVTDNRAALRLRILAHLYNGVASKAAKLSLFITIISFASDTKQLELLAPYLAGASNWPRDWELTDVEARRLYLLLSRVFAKAGDAEQAQSFLIQYLATFEKADAAAMAEAIEHARDAAVGYIRAPALSQRSALSHLAAVRALSGDARYAKLHDLLTIFASQGLDEYLAFQAANRDLVASLGVDHEASLRTMRLLTLCTLAAGKLQLTYEAVAAAIQVPVAEVESWVVAAIGEGLIDAKMDQTAASITVTRASQREFGTAQWGQLQTKLRAWRDSVASLLAVVEGSARA